MWIDKICDQCYSVQLKATDVNIQTKHQSAAEYITNCSRRRCDSFEWQVKCQDIWKIFMTTN